VSRWAEPASKIRMGVSIEHDFSHLRYIVSRWYEPANEIRKGASMDAIFILAILDSNNTLKFGSRDLVLRVIVKF
jgi:hypothetical protein